ncbi:MAG: hypothetical protein AAF921_25965, partial [Cyanobacteria bacterium P01_D01_bin.44]
TTHYPSPITVRLDPSQLDDCFPVERQKYYADLLRGRVGLTRRRAECFTRLWAYLCLKQQPMERCETLMPIDDWVSCTCREAMTLFYIDTDRGSERSAGLMLDKLAALGLIKKMFDGNTLAIAVPPIPELLETEQATAQRADLFTDAFDPRCDAIPVANLLAQNYNWMNRNSDAVPYRIAQLLRDWASQYAVGMRVLRQRDTQNPAGFYLLYPTQRSSEVHFFGPPSKGLHLSALEVTDDRFEMALPGDTDCRAVFARSWIIDAPYWKTHQRVLLQDAQQILTQMQQDFPNLCDIYTLTIHPVYEDLIQGLGFQKLGVDRQSSMYWAYLPLDRFLATELQ